MTNDDTGANHMRNMTITEPYNTDSDSSMSLFNISISITDIDTHKVELEWLFVSIW